jgi:SAM-dependent methyltransferase
MITRSTCRVCESSFEPVLSLGDQYVSNFIAPEEPDGSKTPLELVLCRKCRLLQLRHTAPAELMYQNYWYRSGTNETMRNALADIAMKSNLLIHLKQNDSVLDIGCNDGTLLAAYKTDHIYKIGFDPAKNLAIYSEKIADRLHVGYFESDSYFRDPELAGRRPKIVTSIAMFYDLEDPNRFVQDIKAVMHPDGLWVVQMSYLPLMLKTNEIGNICHEHLEYYSLQSFEYLLDRHDFEVVDVELNDINGGSIRAYIRNRSADASAFADGTYRALAVERVRAMREREKKMGMDDIRTYKEFAFWADRIKQDVTDFIKDQVENGKKVYIYGASTKGNTLLQYYGLNSEMITAAAERNPDKWGKLTIGTHIPIVSEEEARAARPEYFLVLPWHFIEEFQAREKEFLLSGGKFIVPMPHFMLI